MVQRVDKVDNTIKVIVGVVGAIVSILTGMIGLFFTILLGMMLIDFITGGLSAIVTGSGLSSEKGYKGLFKKLYTLLLIGAVFMLEIAVLKTHGVITDGVSTTFIVIEFISILENGNKMGLKLGFLNKLIETAQGKVTLNNDDLDQKKE
jgi:toxin secretion/phage lysis holin